MKHVMSRVQDGGITADACALVQHACLSLTQENATSQSDHARYHAYTAHHRQRHVTRYRSNPTVAVIGNRDQVCVC